MIQNQSEMLKRFTDNYREPFNKKLLERKDEDNINAILSVIKSCEREKFYTIKINNWYTIEDPIEIHNKLHLYEQTIIDNSKNPQDRENEWDYIHIKDSDIILLVVNYIIGIGDKYEDLEVLIMVPKYVNKYYFKIYGNYYIPLYQIVDGSTYNNTGSVNRKVDVVTNKTLMSPIRIFKYQYEMKTIDNIDIIANVFISNVFGKPTSIFKFILTKYGLLDTLEIANLGGIINVTEFKPEDTENLYIFKKNDIYISVPKYLYDNDEVIQSLTYTVYTSIFKNISINDLFTKSFWLCSGGMEINAFTEERGEKLIESIEGIYDEITANILNLPYENKKDIYQVLLWMIKNFTELMQKDNLDVRIKRIRISEYIASLYGAKLAVGIRRISDLGKRAKIQSIKKNINTRPNFLLNQLNKFSLVKYINVVDDSDSTQALCYSFKGLQGIGEKKSSSVSEAQKRLHPSTMGVLDPSTSNKSEPGMSGMICPYADIYDNGFFSEYVEPNNWDETFSELTTSYRQLLGLKEAVIFKEKLGLTSHDGEYIQILDESIDSVNKLLNVAIDADNNTETLAEAIVFI